MKMPYKVLRLIVFLISVLIFFSAAIRNQEKIFAKPIPFPISCSEKGGVCVNNPDNYTDCQSGKDYYDCTTTFCCFQGGTIGTFKGIGILGLENIDINDAPKILGRALSAIFTFLIIVASLWFFISFLIGGIQWIGSGGDSKQIETARSRLTQAIIGIVIVLSVFAFAGLLKTLFGIDLLTFSLPTI